MGELGQPGLGKEPEEVCRLSQLWEGEGRGDLPAGGTTSRAPMWEGSSETASGILAVTEGQEGVSFALSFVALSVGFYGEDHEWMAREVI